MKNTTTELILHKREENTKLMNELNLSNEFERFKNKQDKKHQNVMKKINKTKTIFLTATIAGAAGFAGATSAPLLTLAMGVAYSGVAGYSITRLAEHFYKNNFEHSYGSSDDFFKNINDLRKSFGEIKYKEFVKDTLEENPKLANALSSISDEFKNIKDSLVENKKSLTFKKRKFLS